jgi:hypothetical protein
MASKSDSPPIPPAIPDIQRPGPLIYPGSDDHRVSTRIDPDSCVKPVSSYPDAPPKRY